MSSFKRKATGKQGQTVYPGTRISLASSLSLITSTGISSLDDLLGGGLPLSCSMLYAAPDIHSSYGELIQKYFIAEGLVNDHRLCLIAQDAERFLKDIMWLPKSSQPMRQSESGDEDESQQGGRVKIAWRYEKMKQFQTTVGSPSQGTETYCHLFELSSRVPDDIVDQALRSGRVRLIDPESGSPMEILQQIGEFLDCKSPTATRICIPALGSPGWGGMTAESILRFLHVLKLKLRRHSHGCASVSIAAPISSDSWGGQGWIDKLGWATDGTMTVSAFSANPALSSMFPSHHGLVQMHRFPSPHTQSPPSDRFSSLRGLYSSSSQMGGSGENNLAFKCTRKRLVFETLHLDVEGGTGERRTKPREREAEIEELKEEKKEKAPKKKLRVAFDDML